MVSKNFLTRQQALLKIQRFCAYQERCHYEVKQKLYSYGLYTSAVEEIIVNLIEHDYLNEERFARVYAGGKFRMKKWGRIKITYALKQKGVSAANIKVGLKELEESAYAATLSKLLHEKWQSLTGENNIMKRAKTQAYLLQKGYENNLILEALSQVPQTANPI